MPSKSKSFGVCFMTDTDGKIREVKPDPRVKLKLRLVPGAPGFAGEMSNVRITGFAPEIDAEKDPDGVWRV